MHWNKVHVGCYHKKQCDETTQQSLALHGWTRQQSPISVATHYTNVGNCCLIHWCRTRDCFWCFVNHCIPICSLLLCFVYKWAGSYTLLASVVLVSRSLSQFVEQVITSAFIMHVKLQNGSCKQVAHVLWGKLKIKSQLILLMSNTYTVVQVSTNWWVIYK